MNVRLSAWIVRAALLTAALCLALASQAIADPPAITQTPKYATMPPPQSMTVHAPLMSQLERDVIAVKVIFIGVAVLCVIMSLFIWRTLPPKAPKNGAEGDTAATDGPNARDKSNS